METKPCSACKTAKPRSEFYADRTKSTGLSSRCKRCYSDIHRLTYNGDRRAASIAKARKQHLRTSYGITPEQFAELVERARTGCALCVTNQRPCSTSEPLGSQRSASTMTTSQVRCAGHSVATAT